MDNYECRPFDDDCYDWEEYNVDWELEFEYYEGDGDEWEDD